MKHFLTCFLVLLAPALTAQGQVERILRQLRDPSVPPVLLAAHRSDWRNAPENSLNAMERAIRMGVDIIELDARRTKDGRFVVIHDRTLDRTTTGKGLVADHTLAEIRNLRLLAATGHTTDEKVPTLEEALELARGRAVVDIDKSYENTGEIFAVVEACRALDYSIFTVRAPYGEIAARYPGLLQKVLLMVWADLRSPGANDLIDEYLRKAKPAIVQVVSHDERLLAKAAEQARAGGARLWIDAMWPDESGGHDDERAVRDPEGAYGWLVAQRVGIIQTDRPQYLLDYLKSRQVRPW